MNAILKRAFTLVELMIVLSIIAFLAMMALPSYHRYLASAKRAEAQANLSALYTAQKLYFAEHGKYTDKISGPESLNWKADGEPYYTYGFVGAEGVNYRKGKLGAMQLPAQARVDGNNFAIAAVGDIDGDGKNDVLLIDQNRKLSIVEDDLS